MKPFLSFIFSFVIIHCVNTQNLIPNPSFETVTSTINEHNCTDRKDFDKRILEWFSPTDVSPDVYKLHEENNSFPDYFRLPQPVNGRCLAGIVTNYYYNVCKTYKEYIAVQLKDTLSTDETYIFEFWVSSKETDHFSIGAFFDMEKMDQNQCSMLELPAQLIFKDTIPHNEWKKISFEFKPQKPYSFVTIGNFKREEESRHQYLYLDDFLLTKKIVQKENKEEQIKPIVIEEIFNPQNILFEHGKYKLLPSSFPELDKLVDYLKSKKQGQLNIEGHTDNSGTIAFNQELAINRAEAIKQYLISKEIDANRIIPLGYGQNRPIASNDTEVGRALNRRVVFKIF